MTKYIAFINSLGSGSRGRAAIERALKGIDPESNVLTGREHEQELASASDTYTATFRKVKESDKGIGADTFTMKLGSRFTSDLGKEVYELVAVGVSHHLDTEEMKAIVEAPR